MNTTKNMFFVGIASLALAFTACKKENNQPAPGNPSGEPSTQPQQFKVRMTDAPGDYEALYIEIDKVEAYMEGSGYVTLNSQSQVVSVMDLNNGKEITLASKNDVAVGTYSKIRLTFGDENRIKLNSSSNLGLTLGQGMTATGMYNLNIESMLGQERTVEIEIDRQVSAEAGVSVLLDFNVAASVIEDANEWMLDPVITEIKDANTGVKGEISGAKQASITFVRGNYSTSTTMAATGNFMVRGMDNGTYTVIIDAEVEGQATNETKTITGVTVVRGQIKNMGTIQM